MSEGACEWERNCEGPYSTRRLRGGRGRGRDTLSSKGTLATDGVERASEEPIELDEDYLAEPCEIRFEQGH